MTTQGSGNTKPSLKARNFQLTLNQVEKYDELKNEFQKLKSCIYFISCKEVAPTTGHEHIHIYAHFNNAYQLNKKILASGAHVEICRSSPKQNIDYIKKDGNILDQWGEEPHQGVSITVKELQAIDDPGELDWRQFNTWSKVKAMPQKIKKGEWSKKVEVTYIYGESGSGKSTLAESMIEDEAELIKHSGEFWLGVIDGTGCAIYDEFRDSHMKASEFINLIDYRVQNMNVKGGVKQNKYNKIIITSLQSPHDIYKNMPEEAREQWLRRMKIIHLENNICSPL